ncbi:hypothetical protein MA16_Dca013878 [Dendrobium catenatum]|uniref:Uncharacterized protein n=1 Tax=Dendrobium catenatum TaxID=906689 RepID=A0A2I0WCQ8_9ASPA|nr:hypothetical protein MA16_Dca013878 [Dendrobium catenatum]
MAFKEEAEPSLIVIYSTYEEEHEDTACSSFKECMQADLIDSKKLKASRFQKKRKMTDTPAKRNFCPNKFFVKKAECSSNMNEKGINEDKLEDSDSHKSESDDELSMSPVPKRKKRLTAPAYFAILSGKKKKPWTPMTVNKACRHECVEQNSAQSSVGSFNPDMSESEDDSMNSCKIKKKRLTTPAYRKLLKKCNTRVKVLREVSITENLILISDTLKSFIMMFLGRENSCNEACSLMLLFYK